MSSAMAGERNGLGVAVAMPARRREEKAISKGLERACRRVERG